MKVSVSIPERDVAFLQVPAPSELEEEGRQSVEPRIVHADPCDLWEEPQPASLAPEPERVAGRGEFRHRDSLVLRDHVVEREPLRHISDGRTIVR